MKSFKHGGNMRLMAEKANLPQKEIVDFSANMNPLGLPDWFRPVVSSCLSELVHYPDPDCTGLLKALCDRLRISPEGVLFGNGSTEILFQLPRAFGKKRAVIPVPSYVDYAHACNLAGLMVNNIFLKEEENFILYPERLETALEGDELVFIGQPNNPTGIRANPDVIKDVAGRHPDSLFIIDEAFADFVDGLDRLIDTRLPNILVLCSLTKIFSIPGLRLGFVVGPEESVDQIRELMPPWSVNTISQRVGERAIKDGDFIKRTKVVVRKARERLFRAINELPGLYVYPGEANYLLVRLNRGDMNVSGLVMTLLKKSIAVRDCSNYEGLADVVREGLGIDDIYKRVGLK